MKNFTILFSFMFIILNSCQNNPSAVGMSSWEGVEDMKWHIGTQDAVDIAKTMDAAWKARNYDEMRKYISDTAVISSSGGNTFESPDAFIDRWKYNDSVWDANNSSFTWEFTNLFSIDLDPKTGGEHVHADYLGTWTRDNEKDTFRVMNRYYIIDGKIVVWNSYSQEIIDETTE